MARRSHFQLHSRLRKQTAANDSGRDPVQRALRYKRRGHERKALLCLRQACNESEQDARLWALYGAECVRQGKQHDAEDAFVRSLWLRHRAKQAGRVRSLEQLLEQVRAAA